MYLAFFSIFTRYSERVLISDPSLRKLMAKLSKATPSLPLSSTRFTNLLMSSTFCQSLHTFISQYADEKYPLFELQEFIAAIFSPSAVCAWIRPSMEMRQVLLSICKGSNVRDNPEKLKILQEESPCHFDLVCSVSLSEELRQLIGLPADYALRPLGGQPPYIQSACKEHRSESFFPSLPPIRDRGHYLADKKLSSMPMRCNKSSSSHPSLLPGIFTIFCPHGECI